MILFSGRQFVLFSGILNHIAEVILTSLFNILIFVLML